LSFDELKCRLAMALCLPTGTAEPQISGFFSKLLGYFFLLLLLRDWQVVMAVRGAQLTYGARRVSRGRFRVGVIERSSWNLWMVACGLRLRYSHKRSGRAAPQPEARRQYPSQPVRGPGRKEERDDPSHRRPPLRNRRFPRRGTGLIRAAPGASNARHRQRGCGERPGRAALYRPANR
jgi:hypothetical protein